MIAFDSYCFFENKSNHTGAPMDFFAIVYSLSAVIALLLHRRRFMLPVERWSLRFVALVGIAGALNLIALDRLDVMSEYEAREIVGRAAGCSEARSDALTRIAALR